MATREKMTKSTAFLVLVGVLSVMDPVWADSSSFYRYPNDPDKRRNPIGRAALSFLVPGFDQWTEDQTGAAIAYSGLSVLGIAMALAAAGDRGQYVTTKDDRARLTLLGAQVYQTMGSLSSFHAFRSAITTRKPSGEYPFLVAEETPGDLCLAPFRLDYLIRPTTFVPILVIGGLVAADVLTGSERAIKFSTADGFFTSAFSYQAGVGEEALFRGVMQPALMETVSDRRAFAANLVQALVFGAAHYSPDHNNLPWPQFLFGLYLGWLTQYREYTLSENIFIHVWWDVIAIGATYALSNKTEKNQSVYLPVLNLHF